METITQLESALAVYLGLCAVVAATAGMVAAVIKFWRYAHKDSERNSDHLEDVDEWLASDKRRIEALERHQAEADKQQRLTLKALMLLLGHEVDGNHTAQLAEMRDEINIYLIER